MGMRIECNVRFGIEPVRGLRHIWETGKGGSVWSAKTYETVGQYDTSSYRLCDEGLNIRCYTLIGIHSLLDTNARLCIKKSGSLLGLKLETLAADDG